MISIRFFYDMNNNLKHKTRVNLSLYFLSFLLLIFVSCAKEPKSEMSENVKLVAEYILKFKHLAKKERLNSGVPVSIKLAQGILESKSGKSELATKANNHFGIKCGKKWKGASYKIQSDEWDKKRNKMILKKGCFRAYPNAELCFAAHSDLLKHKRYEQLFTLDKRDYKNWALGLQKLGYATDPDYAKKIIVLIERYRLYEFDNE